jgi:phytanoyl-CoA hydroxylase
MNINLEMQNFYRENGYLLIRNFFSQERMKQAIAAIEEILQVDQMEEIAEMEPKDIGEVRRIWGPTFRHKFYDELMQDSKLLDAIAAFIGNNIVFHYSRINMKSPKIGSPVDWHQDFAYNPHTNTDLMTCLIYLDDADKSNGCLKVIPGSHKNGLCDHYVGNYFRGKVLPENLPCENPIINLEAPAGSVIFLHCLTLHRSDANLSNQARRAFLPSYRASDAYPIYLSRYTSDLEPKTKLVRGKLSNFARVEAANWKMPHPEKTFNSLYEIQEGSHLQKNERTQTGYYASFRNSYP